MTATAAYSFAIRFVIHPASDAEKFLQDLRRQTSSLQIEASVPLNFGEDSTGGTQVSPGEVRMTDYTLLPNTEILWPRVAFTPQLYADFWTTYQSSQHEYSYISLLIVESSTAATQIGEKPPPLELRIWADASLALG